MQPGRSGKGGTSKPLPPPEPYQARCPQHGGLLWGRGAPPKNHLVPMLMGTYIINIKDRPLPIIAVKIRRSAKLTDFYPHSPIKKNVPNSQKT
ncbi:unnamed protein product, partial [Staurois parvus]